MCDAAALSHRRDCWLTGLSLSTCRYDAQRPAADAHLSGRITELALERRRRRKVLATERFPLLRPDAPKLTWSMDFVMDALSNGRRIKCLTCVDDFKKECLTITVAFDISGVQVTRILDSIAVFRGLYGGNRNRSGPGVYLPRTGPMGL